MLSGSGLFAGKKGKERLIHAGLVALVTLAEWEKLEQKSQDKHLVCAPCCVPSTLSALSLSVLSRTLFIASFTAGEIAFKRSQVICSRSGLDPDGFTSAQSLTFIIEIMLLDILSVVALSHLIFGVCY